MANFAALFPIPFIVLLLFSYSATAVGDHVDVYTSNGNPWCVASASASDEQLQANVDYACSKVDCGPIGPGGSCFLPNTIYSHTYFAMNSYYQTFGRTLEACSFNHTGVIVVIDPSYGDCHYL